MKYPPKHHQDSEFNHIIEVIKTYPLATVISVNNNQPFITHLPLIYRESDKKLIGHIDIYNPQTALMKDENEVNIVFNGPQCYISPSIYSTTQLPTYNYIKVHIKGRVTAIESKAALKASLIKMTAFLEAPEHNYILEPNNKRMEGALDYIKMFEISIDSWEGKLKLSQDKNNTDMNNAKAELIRANQVSIENFLNKVLK